MRPTSPRRRTAVRLVGVIAAASIVVAACGDDDEDSVSTEPAATEAPAASEVPAEATAALADVCPSPLVIQTDWFPEAEHGALYQLLGTDYTIDTDAKTVTGPMILSDGSPAGIDVEIRTGGPAIGFSPVSAQMYTDTAIHLGYVSTDEAALNNGDLPTIAVVAPLEKNPQIIMWDPETYPDVKTIADLGELGTTINVFAGGTFIDVFVSEGVLSADQIDPSYDGGSARFIVEEGKIAQQGFASESPFSYEQLYPEWGKPVAYQLIHDAGLEVYAQPLAIRADDLETLTPCLEKLVPAVQQATVDYTEDPAAANAIIVETVEKYADFWVYPQELADFADQTMIDLGLVGNGDDATIGNFIDTRVQGVIDKMIAAGMEVPAELTAADISTNDFIDPAIGLPG